MCGIVCWIRKDPSAPIDEDTLNKMLGALKHRGPDGSGVFVDEQVGLGHHRLAILDAQNGAQPLRYRHLTISFNGEIYNFRDLRSELMSLGYEFDTECDTEVLLKGYHCWRSGVLEKLRGMFAFIIHDSLQKEVFFARDRLGIKPLYWACISEGDILFASELKAITAHPNFEKTLNHQAVEDFFSLGYVTDPKSIYTHAFKVPPGHCGNLCLDDFASVVSDSYWSVEDAIESRDEVPHEAYETFSTLIDEAVSLRMIADVPVGAFLSGGLDSTAITALMSKKSNAPVRTCSIGFDMAPYDESFFAEKVASDFGTQHITTNVSVNDLSLVDTIIDVYDEPFGDNSAIPTYILSKITRDQVKVALSGDGADELFFGYRNHKMIWYEERVRKLIPAAIRKPVFGSLARLYPSFNILPKFLKAKTTLWSLSKDAVTSYHNAISVTSADTLTFLYSTEFKQKLSGYRSLKLFQSIVSTLPKSEPLKQIQLIDFKTYLPSGILTKVDRASMVNSLEVRVPFLDHKLVEWALGIAPDLNISWSRVKAVIANGMASIIPKYVSKREKMGFSSPLDEWFRQIPLATLENRILSEDFIKADIFVVEHVKQLLAAHHKRKADHGVTIWSLLIFEAFLRKQSGPVNL